MLLSLFENGLRVTAHPLDHIVALIRGDAYKDLFEQFSQLQNAGKRDELKLLSRRLPYFTPSGDFKDRCRVERLRTYSGLMLLDVVDVAAAHRTVVRELIEADPFTHICYETMNNAGFKIIVKTDATIKNHRLVYADLRKYFLAKLDDFILQIDPDGDAIEKRTLLTHDKNVFVQASALTFIYTPLSSLGLNGDKKAADKNGSHAMRFSGETLMNIEMPEMPCLWEPFFPQTGMGAIVGSSDGGKSAFCRQLAIAIALGQKQFLGFPLKPVFGRALFVSSEDDVHATCLILKRQVRAFSNPKGSMRNIDFMFNTEQLIENLDRELLKLPVDLVVLDAFGDIFTGKEMNSITQVRAHLHAFGQLAQRHKCFFLFIHHVGKRTDALEPSKHNAIGSQAFEAKMRIVLELRTTETDLRAKNLYVTKGNYLPSAVKKGVYQLAFDEETLTFELMQTLNERPLSKKAHKPYQKYDINWQTVFAETDALPYSELVTQLTEQFGVPEATSKRYIKEHLVRSEINGLWQLVA